MMRRLVFCVLVVALTPASAVDKTIQELMRDVGLLQDQVRQLQQSQTASLAALQTLMQQALDAANRADRDVAVIQSGFQQSGNQLKDQVVAPVVGLSTRMDQVSGDVRTLQQAVADLTSSMSKMSAQLSDINNAIKVLSAPPPPPQQTGSTGMPGAIGAASNTPAMSQTDLYNAATADYNSGKFELAAQEFQDFLKYYGNTDLAPAAQYWVGQIYYSNKKYDDALQAFDAVLTKYPENAKTRDAKYYKGMSLVALRKLTAAHSIFADMEKTYPPSSDAYTRACAADKDIGFNCAKASAATTAHKKR
jgi:tol-pal system protein YbgF